jgi:hypothetical protein
MELKYSLVNLLELVILIRMRMLAMRGALCNITVAYFDACN